MTHFYHYTGALRAMRIFNETDYRTPGLVPIRRFLNMGLGHRFNLPARASEGVTSGFLEPMPREWHAHGALEDVFRNISDPQDTLACLRVEITPNDDVCVADWGAHLHADYIKNELVDPMVFARVKWDYFKSLVPLVDYQGNYAMPEIICFSAIPLKRVQVVEQTPRWKLINRVRAANGQPRILPPKPASDRAFAEFLGVPAPQDNTSAAAVIPFTVQPRFNPRP